MLVLTTISIARLDILERCVDFRANGMKTEVSFCFNYCDPDLQITVLKTRENLSVVLPAIYSEK